MPKMKTKSSAKKRFTVTGSGKIKRKHAFKSHILTKKTKKQKKKFDTRWFGSQSRHVKYQVTIVHEISTLV